MLLANYEPTPTQAARALEPYIKGKVVYDLGAGEGRFAKAMAEYAEKVVCVEAQEGLAEICQQTKLQVIHGNFLEVNLQEAEVIYVFLSFMGMYALTNHLAEIGWKGTVISHYYPMHKTSHQMIAPDDNIDVDLGYVRFPFLIYQL